MQKTTTTSTANHYELVNGPSPFSSTGCFGASIPQENDRLTNTDKSMTHSSHNQHKSFMTLPSSSISQESRNLNNDVTGHVNNELIKMPSNISDEVTISPNRDDRVRNPVPGKLKGKNSSKQGNFGIMHMDMINGKKEDPKIKDAAAEPNIATRRISEAVSYQEKVTKPDQQVPPKKIITKGVSDNSGSDYESSPAVYQEDYARQLAPGDTKIEQARLLTLLRSINPITVVDQLCKAVAYFGGIPGAPPPEDGIYPKGVVTKETGALFIGWVAEIFPDLSFRSSRISKRVPFSSEATTIDSLVENCDGTARGDALTNELPNPKNGYGFGAAFSGYPWALSLNESIIAGNKKLIEQRLNTTSIKELAEESSSTTTCKRKRGRPKGSRNKKFLGPQRSENPVKSASYSESQKANLFANEILNISSEVAANQFNRLNHDTLKKISTHADSDHNQQYKESKSFWTDSQKKICKSKLNRNFPTDFELNSKSRTILEASRNDGPEIPNTERSSEQRCKESYSETKVQELSKNRKLQALVPTTEHEQIQTAVPSCLAMNGVSNSRINDSSSVRNPENTQGNLKTSKTENSIEKTKNRIKLLSTTDKSNLSMSSTKDPRTGNLNYPNSGENMAQNPSNSEDRDTIPSISQAARVENKIMPSQNDAPVSPPFHAELKKNYEQLATLQQFQTRNDVHNLLPQQLALQNPKSSTSSDQLATPLTPQQNITKINQTNSQHNEMMSTPGSLKRPTPTSFYNQRPQASMPKTSYSQQSSQLYSENQASPLINHGSYQNLSSFTQQKSQFSSSESNYGTLSSYNVSQSSPSYAQSEDGHRTPSSQKIKHSTAFSNSENDHRNSNTHPIAQQIQSFPNPRSQNINQSTQHAYSQLNEASLNDLPTLDSRGQANNSNSSNLNSSEYGYGQNLGVNIATSRAMTGSNHLYDGMALNPYEANTNYLLRAVVPQNSHNTSSNLYTNPSLGSTSPYDFTTTNDVGDRLIRNSERYR